MTDKEKGMADAYNHVIAWVDEDKEKRGAFLVLFEDLGNSIAIKPYCEATQGISLINALVGVCRKEPTLASIFKHVSELYFNEQSKQNGNAIDSHELLKGGKDATN